MPFKPVLLWTDALLFLLIKMGSLGSVKVVSPDVGMEQVVTSRVQSGLVFCFLACLALVSGTFLLFRELVLRNGALKCDIEAAWDAAGLPTFRGQIARHIRRSGAQQSGRKSILSAT